MTTNETDCKITAPAIDYKKHWNAAYSKNSTEKLGWYEESSAQTLALIKETKIAKNATILNVGAGSSTIIDNLLAAGFSNIIANDLAEASLTSLKSRVGDSGKVQFLVDDLLNPSKLNTLENIDLWNDRAVLHFFLKEEEIATYFNLLKKILKLNGFVIIAVFAENGAEKCCGLPLKRYSVAMLQNNLGPSFELIKSFNHTFVNPNGDDRPYIYSLFQRKS
ncbi:class I SAM-dependent methyltransferase [Polaribacter sp. ALD11]|uniref:class I SAM-dependent methyltransferase n=1 Tax=Polaribacter sp. ALD11 TaxID=2058137 RepID=UPI000C307889|nr:methyltransferase domain-containing protein [Polaribacter sp. ALD11]AUC83903.1 class I SAM-dependent methyltransferase [Polaribacter sp. ALD11]